MPRSVRFSAANGDTGGPMGWEVLGDLNRCLAHKSSLKEIMVPGRVHHALHVHRNSPALVTLALRSLFVVSTVGLTGQIN